MAKKKTSSSSKKKGKIPVEIFGILYIVLTILGLLRSGFVGRMVSNFGIFLFGAFYNWGLVYFLLVGGYVLLFRERPKLFTKKLIGFYLFAIAILSMSHVKYIMYDTNVGSAVFQDTLANIVSGFNDVNFIQGGGILGAIFSYLFVLAFDVLGSKIICWVLILFGAMLIFNISPATLLRKIILFFVPKKWLNKKDSDDELEEDEVEAEEKESPKDKRVVISNINDLNPTHLEEVEEDSEPVINGEYKLPPISLLNVPKKVNTKANEESISSNIKLLEQVLTDFDIHGKVVAAHVGPTVTQYELELQTGTKLNKVLSIHKEIALVLAAKDIRIEAPIPGKSTVGIEIPNRETTPVSFREVMEKVPASKSSSKLLCPLGKNIMGNVVWCEIDKTPHLLVAGSTGSGKSVCINGIIASILMRTRPDEVKLVMVDPKKVELSVYNGVPHLLCPVVTDPKKASVALNKIVAEMERRYEVFEESHTKNIATYNSYIDDKNKNLDEDSKIPRMPYIVVIVDELADLMLVASKDVEASIMRITQMARAAGIHLIIATQRPSTDVITGVVKANIPSRISFAVSSGIDSRTILDSTGAEKLLGKGDMLFLPMGEASPQRIQGAFIADDEIKKIIDYTIEQQKAEYNEAFLNLEASSNMDKSASQKEDMEQVEDDDDELYNDVVAFVVEQQKASASLLQRRFKVGYNRAARIIDLLEERGIIGPTNGSKPREVLVKLDNGDED